MADDPNQDPNEEPGNTGQGDGGSSQQKPPEGSSSITITQEALDKMIKDRVDRAARSAVSNFLGDLGYDDPDRIKTDLSKFKEIQDSQKSELEKLQDDLNTATERANTAEGQLTQAREELVGFKKRVALSDAAREAGFLEESLGDVWLLASSNGEFSKQLLIDEDSGDVKGAKEVVGKIAKVREHWLQPQDRKGAPGRHTKPPQQQQRQRQQEPELPEVPLVNF